MKGANRRYSLQWKVRTWRTSLCESYRAHGEMKGWCRYIWNGRVEDCTVHAYGIVVGNLSGKLHTEDEKEVEDDMKLDLEDFDCEVWLCWSSVMMDVLLSVQALLNLGFGCYSETDLSVKVQSKLGGRLASIPGRGIVGFFSGGRP